MFILAKIVSEKLRNLIEIEKLKDGDFVFLSNRGKKYDVRSLQQVVKKAAKSAELN